MLGVEQRIGVCNTEHIMLRCGLESNTRNGKVIFMNLSKEDKALIKGIIEREVLSMRTQAEIYSRQVIRFDAYTMVLDDIRLRERIIRKLRN